MRLSLVNNRSSIIVVATVLANSGNLLTAPPTP
ncbi:hypothetical protein CCACVL1_22421 [Corchorus capsularis]|uniref:Uncharacterized protein n=1 Tax=Corchorus capsularis TaxID=210143 RepID=A0A1R3GZ15_COCAP|nr:hypothetical protein CCACVL1_22421 [Corchorus capsularis]